MHQNSLHDQRQSTDNDSYLNIAFRGKKTYGRNLYIDVSFKHQPV